MRAHEFIFEGRRLGGKMSKVSQYATRGLNVFSGNEQLNTNHALNRVMMATACTDGKEKVDMPMQSWAGKYNIANPYTKEEQDKLKLAYEALGLEWEDINNGDMESSELDSTYSTSPVKPFKGYKK